MDDQMKSQLEEIKKKIEQQEDVKAAERLVAEKVFKQLKQAMRELQDAKPSERNELARRYAVTITELEKVIAYFRVYVLMGMQ